VNSAQIFSMDRNWNDSALAETVSTVIVGAVTDAAHSVWPAAVEPGLALARTVVLVFVVTVPVSPVAAETAHALPAAAETAHASPAAAETAHALLAAVETVPDAPEAVAPVCSVWPK